MSDTCDTLETRCAAHANISVVGNIAMGTVFGDWRVTAFIGRGGSGEVYCAEHVTLGTPAAVKVLVYEEERAKLRFEREARLLAGLKSEAFPRFYAYGEANGRAYLAMELLEPGYLPSGDKAVAQFLLKVCDAVAELHSHGLVHRDIKPGNILWRSGIPVLSDMGLVKAVGDAENANPAFPIPHSKRSVSHGAGTPGYGAPEQMERGEVSFVSDIHALGVMADRCFNGRLSRAWIRIIRRATSSIPAHRYPSVAAFARAIRTRNYARNVVVSLLSLVVACMIVVGPVVWWVNGGMEFWTWRSMCRPGEIESITTSYERLDKHHPKYPGYIVRRATNRVEGTIIHLPSNTVSFSRPIRLKAGEYRIVGPGRLDADITGPSNTVLRLKNCQLNNLTDVPYPRNGINYHLEGGAYLNLVRQQNKCNRHEYINIDDGMFDNLRFGGPMTLKELRAEKFREHRDMTNVDASK